MTGADDVGVGTREGIGQIGFGAVGCDPLPIVASRRGVDAQHSRSIGKHRASLQWKSLGSVSNPITDDLRASYVIVHADAHGHRVEHRQVAYDRDEFLARLARSGHPELDFIASFQHGQQIRHRTHRPGPIASAG